MNSEVVFAVRASPDWAGLARDYAAGESIDCSRFMPAKHRHFPLDIPDHIGRWNRLSKLSFFACRERIRVIAARTLADVEGATVVRADDVPEVVERSGDMPILLYHLDDDDWFHPHMSSVLRRSGHDPNLVDAIVSPFFRLAKNLVTFTLGGGIVSGALGRCEPFRYRYCTNNYGLTARALATGPAELVEHIDASAVGDATDFVDLHIDTVISATNKTPCSAGWVRELPEGEAAFREHILSYVAALDEIGASSPHDWVNAPLRETRDLFLETVD